MFTENEVWFGGFYELSIEIGKYDEVLLDLGIKNLWEVAPISGCYSSSYKEPIEQQSIAPNLANYLQFGHLYGVLTVIALGEMPCGSLKITDSDGTNWLNLYVPLGWLADNIDNVGGFPYGGNDDESKLLRTRAKSWREPLENTFIEIAKRLFEATKFQSAVIGYEVSGAVNYADMVSRGIPDKRYITYLINRHRQLEIFKTNAWD